MVSEGIFSRHCWHSKSDVQSSTGALFTLLFCSKTPQQWLMQQNSFFIWEAILMIIVSNVVNTCTVMPSSSRDKWIFKFSVYVHPCHFLPRNGSFTTHLRWLGSWYLYLTWFFNKSSFFSSFITRSCFPSAKEVFLAAWKLAALYRSPICGFNLPVCRITVELC